MTAFGQNRIWPGRFRDRTWPNRIVSTLCVLCVWSSRFLVGVVKIFGGFRPKFRSFFFSPTGNFILSSLSGVFSWIFGGVCEGRGRQMRVWSSLVVV